ncbi:PSD1 and planctomycete cytochrome C domain-containing protein [Parapedobacter sp. 10938]|uniref:PSD1 and planctomycete cytochrome C domain-containing protein n=1 Tax=Parapedobacter flavus TaxID=3110225 RepID=UPI002DBE5667|nr:PSD1 and planctomycete cytochrome C domain-containing protein [Parapedobacter sp. 10938]MEC3881358.1 PSD1 and planctomycete cytochrome C domain-containing protein [Parapedobacter sp. 10938]
MMTRLLSAKWFIGTAIILIAVLLSAYFYTSRKNSGGAGSAPMPAIVDYNYHIRPILSDNCFACHGPDPNAREADLRLDTEEGAYKALVETAGMHAIVPGHPDRSEAYRRITSTDEMERMPPVSSNLALTDREIKLIEQWIEQGAEYKPHWAFLPPEQGPIPTVDDEYWATHAIDRFVLTRMEENGFEPNPEAKKHYLLRRMSFDLTGLPPTEEQLQRFLADDSENAYEKMVDELMAMPAYGERMAMHWLDVARYADSYGYQDDDIRTQWPWRDWVIHAFNRNMPYDRFVTWQLAGDMLPEATKEQVLASAFNRNHKITEEGGVIEEEYRVAYAIDKTNTFSKGILGITMECAQCHDHKYDPFSQKNYFQLYAFFNNSLEKGLEGLVNSGPSKTPRLTITQQDVEDILQFINKGDDTSAVSVSVMGERDEVRPTFILDRGLYDSPTERVYPSTPEAILPFDSTAYESNRLGLAEWAFSKENPLTARVLVNQLWAMVFGRGLVATVADFGNQGDLPSHPELLDWLAADFRDNGWNVKRLMKQLVMSATYRQSSRISERQLNEDPENIYLSRSKRLRLSAESIRDLALASSGLLNTEIGGPSIKPYQPDGLWEVTSSGRGALANYVQDHGEDLYRRGMYVFIKLTVPPPNMLIFDASNRDMCEVTRQRTNTPLQALVMLNDPVILEASRVLSGRLMRAMPNARPSVYIEHAYRRILSRDPSGKELSLMEKYYIDELERYNKAPDAAQAFLTVGEAPQDTEVPVAEHAALMAAVHALYNLEEAITRT